MLCLAGLIGLVIQRRTQGRLRAELVRLTREEKRARWLANDNGRLASLLGARSSRKPGPAHDGPTGSRSVESLANVGWASPTNAFETLVWAAAKGDEASLARSLGLSPGALDQARSVIAGLPKDRAETPEELVGIFLQEETLRKISSLQFISEAKTDPTHATVEISVNSMASKPIAMVFVTDHWAMWVPPEAVAGIKRRLSGELR